MSKRNPFGNLKLAAVLVTLLAIAGIGLAGDSFYGTCRAIKRGDLVTFEYDGGSVDIRIAGIDVPQDRDMANRAARFLEQLVLNKDCRFRVEGRIDGQLTGRLLTDDPNNRIKDVGAELVRSGLVARQTGYDYKYGEMTIAESEAKQARRGIWKTPR
jgi:endonuclease YncB( thermonuclease family)